MNAEIKSESYKGLPTWLFLCLLGVVFPLVWKLEEFLFRPSERYGLIEFLVLIPERSKKYIDYWSEINYTPMIWVQIMSSEGTADFLSKVFGNPQLWLELAILASPALILFFLCKFLGKILSNGIISPVIWYICLLGSITLLFQS